MAKGKGGNPKWKKGIPSPNPSGRPKEDPEIRALCKAHSQEAIETAISIMRDKAAKETDRIKCVEIILERAYGKPIQPTKDLGQGESYAEFLKSLNGA